MTAVRFIYFLSNAMKPILKKRITMKAKCRPDEVIVMAGWFIRLYELGQMFEKNPSEVNKHMLLGYISSAEFIVTNLTKKI